MRVAGVASWSSARSARAGCGCRPGRTRHASHRRRPACDLDDVAAARAAAGSAARAASAAAGPSNRAGAARIISRPSPRPPPARARARRWACGSSTPGMAGVEVDVDVVDVAAGRREIVEALVRVQVVDRDHVDGADQLAVVVVGEERPAGSVAGSTKSWPMPGRKSGSLTSSLTSLKAPAAAPCRRPGRTPASRRRRRRRAGRRAVWSWRSPGIPGAAICAASGRLDAVGRKRFPASPGSFGPVELLHRPRSQGRDADQEPARARPGRRAPINERLASACATRPSPAGSGRWTGRGCTAASPFRSEALQSDQLPV